VREGKRPRSCHTGSTNDQTEKCSVFEKFRSDPVPRPTRPKRSKPPESFAKLNSILPVLTLR
jgi:hypothetical protein